MQVIIVAIMNDNSNKYIFLRSLDQNQATKQQNFKLLYFNSHRSHSRTELNKPILNKHNIMS